MAVFFTDFGEYTTGSQPSDWTERWHTGSHAASVQSTGAPVGIVSDRALRITGASDGRYVLSWDKLDGTADIQTLMKVQWEHTSDLNDVYGSSVRGSGDDTSESDYHVQIRIAASTSLLVLYDSSLASSLGSTGKLATRNTWWWIRTEASGTTIRCKLWEDGTSEPGTWDVSTTDSTHASGWAGIWRFESDGTVWVAQYSAGTNGDAAPSTEPPSGTPIHYYNRRRAA